MICHKFVVFNYGRNSWCFMGTYRNSQNKTKKQANTKQITTKKRIKTTNIKLQYTQADDTYHGNCL